MEMYYEVLSSVWKIPVTPRYLKLFFSDVLLLVYINSKLNWLGKEFLGLASLRSDKI